MDLTDNITLYKSTEHEKFYLHLNLGPLQWFEYTGSGNFWTGLSKFKSFKSKKETKDYKWYACDHFLRASLESVGPESNNLEESSPLTFLLAFKKDLLATVDDLCERLVEETAKLKDMLGKQNE